MSERLLRLFLGFFPREFRSRFGESMLETSVERYQECRRRGRLTAANMLLRTLVNFFAEGIRERWRPSLDSSRRFEKSWRSRRSPTLASLGREMRFAVRALRRRPGFALLAVVTLALGVGANTAIFSVVHAVLLKPLPYPEPGSIVSVLANWTGPEAGLGSMSYPDLADLESEAEALESLVGVNTTSLTLTELGEPRVIRAARVTKGLMETFRVSPELGRDIRADEFGPVGPRVVVLGYGFWQAHFGGLGEALGQTLTLNGNVYEVVGVASRYFDYPGEVELWIPRRLDIEDCGRGCHTMTGVGRLAPDSDLETARTQLTTIASNLTASHPETNTNKEFLIRSLHDRMVGGVRPGLLLLLGAVGLVVLIACTNVANLLLVRAADRTGEYALRTAIGASRAQLVVQSLVESAVLAAMGAAGGLVLAFGILNILPRIATGIPRIELITIDVTVLGYTLLTAILSIFVFGAAPAWALVRSSVRSGLAGNRLGEPPNRRRFKNLLLASEVGLSAMLVVGAGLLLRTFLALYAVDVGFDPQNLTRFSVILPEASYQSLDSARQFYRELEDEIRALPGVASVGSVWGPPLGRGHATGTILVEGRPKPPPELEREASIHSVGPGWLSTMRIQLADGRGFETRDEVGGEPVAIINETFVREIFPLESPLGKRLSVSVSLGHGSPQWRIVGVIKDLRSRALDEKPEAEIYVPQGHFGPRNMTVTIRTEPGAASPLRAARELVTAKDANVPIYRVETVQEAVDRQLAPTRFYFWLVGAFAAVAALLAGVGLYGVVSERTSHRTREIGLRVALGAKRAGILGLVLADGLGPAFVGLLGGLTAAFFGAGVMNAVLFGVQPRDPWIFIGTSLLLTAVAVVATFVPARRASRIDPARALRAD